jgi:glycosyltransferase involved in cell wall biosynthesis
MAKILFISSLPYFQWRGSSLRVSFDVRALAELGHTVDLLTLPIGEDKDIPGVRVIRVSHLPFVRDIPIGPSFWKACFDLKLLLRALSMVHRGGYDVVHCVEDTGPVGYLVSRFGRTKLVFEKHSDPASHRKGVMRNLILRLYAGAERFTAMRADAVIGTGPGLVKQVESMKTGKPVHHIFDIPSSLVDASEEQALKARSNLGIAPGDIVVTYVGSFAVYQGVELLFSAMPAVLSKLPDVKFLVIGGTPAEIAALKERLASNELDKRVLLPGKISPDELPAYLAGSDILLSPRMSGLNTPLKILDYFKAGRAIAATNTEANRLLLSGNNAVLVQPDSAGLAAGIEQLVKDKDLRLKLGENGRNLVLTMYNFTEFKARLDNCYKGLRI